MTSPLSTNSAFSKILLDHISKQERDGVLRALIASLPTSNRLDLEFVASLVESETDQAIKHDFIDLLDRAICRGDIQNVLSICLQYPVFREKLLCRSAERVSKAKSVATDQSQDDNAVRSYLQFSTSVLSHTLVSDAHRFLFNSCLDLLLSEDTETVERARDLVFAVLATNDKKVLDAAISPAQAAIWKCIQELVTSENNKATSLLGYSLWLRWILSRNQVHNEEFVTDDYWPLLISGLRQRDTERRKICLNILRLTTATDSMLVSTDESEQYQRYCTVFETIVLGRYINQIQECENELNTLVQSTFLHPHWLCVLLASAIDSHMQDSNRKFIGNWVMRSDLRQTPNFLQFFLDDFIPWAIQGPLFVSTLKWLDGQRQCLHGDRLSQYLRRLLADGLMHCQLVESLVNMILDRKNTIFAYAIVYILEGLKGALSDEQKEKLAQLTNLPEVARDFVRRQTTGPLDFQIKPGLSSRRYVARK